MLTYLCFLKLWKALSVGKFCLLSLSTLNGTPPKGDLIKFTCDTLKGGSHGEKSVQTTSQLSLRLDEKQIFLCTSQNFFMKKD